MQVSQWALLREGILTDKLRAAAPGNVELASYAASRARGDQGKFRGAEGAARMKLGRNVGRREWALGWIRMRDIPKVEGRNPPSREQQKAAGSRAWRDGKI